MEYTWIVFALAGMIALWLGDFIKKLLLTKGIDKDIFLFLCFCLYIPVFWIVFFVSWSWVFERQEIIAALIVWVCNFCIPLGMLTAFKYLNMSFALVTIRLISSFLILWVGYYILSDSLTWYNILGFFIGAFAIYLLSGYTWWTRQSLHPKWFIALIACIGWIVIWNSYFKYILPEIVVFDYMALQFTVTWVLIFVYMFARRKLQYISMQEVTQSLPYVLASGVIFLIHFLYLLPNIYLLWTLSLSYKMLSYSLIIPILLSILFLWEPVDKKRLIAFWLTIISIFLFL